MNCPVCHKEMKKGRLTAGGYWIRWVPEGGVDLFHAVTIRRFSLCAKGTPAYICQTCRKLIADY